MLTYKLANNHFGRRVLEVILNLATATIIRHIASVFDKAFPDRVRAIYLIGSYAGDYAVVGSDIDFDVILSGLVTDEDRKQANTLVHRLGMITDIELDIGISSEHDEVRPALIMSSVLVHGEDVRDHLKMMSLDYWIRERMHAGCYLICHVFGQRRQAVIPIAFPNATEEFYGYSTHRGDTNIKTTKNLVRATSWAATALTALMSQQFIISKLDLLEKCPEHLDEKWANYISTLFAFCRDELHYRLPTSTMQRRELKVICKRNREFEDFYLTTYRDFLLDELVADTRRIKQSLDFLNLTGFCAPEVLSMVEHIQKDGDPSLTYSASQALISISLYCS